MEPETARQPPLSLRWETRGLWPALCAEFGGNECTAAVILALATSGKWTSYSRRMAHYSVARRYRSKLYTYRGVVSAVDHLDRMQLIDHDRRAPGQLGWQSAARGRPELIARTNAILAGGPKLQIARPPETIILKGKDGELLDYKDNEQTIRRRRSAQEINEAIEASEISHHAAAPLRRVFNENFGRGGRFYASGASWQNMKAEDRKRIKIDDEPVAELDFRCMHASLLYNEAGAKPPADSYTIPPWPRSLVKIALLICINAKNRAAARLAIAHHERIGEVAAPGSQEAMQAADRLIDDLETFHAPISRYFHSDAGARLMEKDARIAERVMHMMLRKGVVTLPLHDSFLTARSKAGLLQEAMQKAAHEEGVFHR
jgi:hypothetical protein